MARSMTWVFVAICSSVGASEPLVTETFHSPDGRFKAVVSSPSEHRREEPSRVSLSGPELGETDYALFTGYPDAVHLLNDGRLVTVGRRNHLWPVRPFGDGGSMVSEFYLPVAEPERQLIAVFGTGGELLYSADLRDLWRVAGPIDFVWATHSNPFWYRTATVVPGGAAVTIILADHHELRLALDDLSLVHVPVPNEALQGDREKLRTRAEAYLAVDNPEAVSVLKELLESDPGDHEAAYLLTRHLRHEGDLRASIAILRRLAEEHPLGSFDTHSSCITPGDAYYVRCQLIRAYLDDGQPEQAMAVIEEIRSYANPHTDFEFLEIRALLTLDRIEDADAVADRLLVREQDSVLLDWHVRTVVSMYERRGLHDRADALFANAVGDMPMDPDLLHDRANEMIRSGRERAAVPLLERLLDSEVRMKAAMSLGQIHADDRGDISMDLDVARDWFRIAVDSANLARNSRHDPTVALQRLCHISLVEKRLDDVVEWCGERAGGEATFWMSVVFLDPAYRGHDVDRGLRLLESAGGPPRGWNPEGTYFRTEYDEQLHAWAVRTLERHVDTDNTYLLFSLGLLYDGNGGRPNNPERAVALLGKAADRDHTDAMLSYAHVKRKLPCDVSCWQEVWAVYKRAADLGEKWGYYYLAEIILERGSDVGLSAAEDYLGTFSEMSKRERSEWACDSLGLVRDRSPHSAERLYEILERRLGRAVTRIPDRGCT